MTIYFGTLIAGPGNRAYTLPYPLNQESVQAVRLTNTSRTVTLVLGNMVTAGQSQEYLLPGQTQVWKYINGPASVPTARANGGGITDVGLTVEWSDDAESDFIGQYPSTIAPYTT